LASGGELLFCGHHARKHLPALTGIAEISDETGRLSSEPSLER